ncbi:MAG: HD domain-containing protein [Firmicutes bacterium]|nr:HD domain-containing protein [Bacillota bacterium]MBQ2042662.1 HD domain-containing protein [Bacillota bacterium]
MKEHYINALAAGSDITDFFMVKSIGIKMGSNKKNYLDLMLGDSSGEMNGKKWDVSDEEADSLMGIAEGDIVKIKAQVTEWNGIRQLRIGRIRKAEAKDELQMADFVKAAPEDPQEMFSYVLERANAIKDEGLKMLAVNALEENREKLLYYPGAMRNHHAELAGLLYHIRRMLTMGLKACQVYTNLDKDWVVCGVIMHDMEKLSELKSNEMGISSGYTASGNMLGHLVMGAIKLEERAKAAGLSEEKTVMMQHMIISHHYEPEFGSPIKPLFPEAELLHYLDMLDAKMFDFEAALETAEPGSFTERVRTLDGRMLYKPTFEMTNTEKNKR